MLHLTGLGVKDKASHMLSINGIDIYNKISCMQMLLIY